MNGAYDNKKSPDLKGKKGFLDRLVINWGRGDTVG
jgi:hypothetical protein